MAARGLFSAADLEPLIAERGIALSSVQVWRLVTQVPERLSLQVLAALCDILEATPADLIATRAEGAAALPKVAAAGTPADPGAIRPRRATLKPQAE
jgi:DNA-binding Xre family transcriptional regulator